MLLDRKKYNLLLDTAERYISQFLKVLPKGCVIEIGGSLRSKTVIVSDCYDIDLRLLLPSKLSNVKQVISISHILHKHFTFDERRFFKKIQNEKFVHFLRKYIKVKNIPNAVMLDVTIHPKEGFIEWAKFTHTLPRALINTYLEYKSSI